MKRKLNLSEWAALAEVVGMLGVIISLVFLVIGINRSTAEATAGTSQGFFDAVQTVEMAVSSDAEWSAIVVAGRKEGARLSEIEQFRYDAYVISMVDNWDLLQSRFDDGLMKLEILEGWDEYFSEWARRHVSPATWDRIKWQNYNLRVALKLEKAIGVLQAVPI
jgi:hypothetical protein